MILELGRVLFDKNKDVVSGVNWAQKSTKTLNVGYNLFPLKHFILKDCLETVFVFWETYLWLKFEQTRAIFEGERAQKLPPSSQKWGYFLTTTNATLVKHTAIMYLHKTFNLAEDWGVTHRVQESVN